MDDAGGMSGLRGVAAAALLACLGAGAEAQRLRQGSYASLEDTTFCVTEASLDALIRLRDAEDRETLPAGCFTGTAVFFPEQVLPHREARLRVARADPEGRETCLRPTTRERRRCTVTVERMGFVAGWQADENGQRLARRIFVAVPPHARIQPPDRQPQP